METILIIGIILGIIIELIGAFIFRDIMAFGDRLGIMVFGQILCIVCLLLYAMFYY